MRRDGEREFERVLWCSPGVRVSRDEVKQGRRRGQRRARVLAPRCSKSGCSGYNRVCICVPEKERGPLFIEESAYHASLDCCVAYGPLDPEMKAVVPSRRIGPAQPWFGPVRNSSPNYLTSMPSLNSLISLSPSLSASPSPSVSLLFTICSLLVLLSLCFFDSLALSTLLAFSPFSSPQHSRGSPSLSALLFSPSPICFVLPPVLSRFLPHSLFSLMVAPKSPD